MVHYERPQFFDQPAVVGWVLDNSPAAKAGIEQGDRIVRIDGEQNPTWEDVILKVMISPKQPIDIAIQRGKDILQKQIQPQSEGSDEYGSVGWQPDQPVTVTELEPNMPAIKAGVHLNDEIAAVNGQPMRSVFSLIHYLQQNGDKPVVVTVIRNGNPINLTMTPVQTDENGQKGYRLGFLISGPMRVEKLPFAKALNQSLQENKRYSLLMIDLLHKMVERKASIKQFDGPDRYRARVRRRGPAARLDSAARADGHDQLESRHHQPAADSDSRWRRDHAADYRSHHAARHQHADQGTHLPDRICLFGAVCGGGHLQRLDEGSAWPGATPAISSISPSDEIHGAPRAPFLLPVGQLLGEIKRGTGSIQPRSGGICVSRGREPAVEWGR